MSSRTKYVLLNLLGNEVYPGSKGDTPEPDLRYYARELTKETGETFVVVPLCDRCQKYIARVIEYDHEDEVKHHLCLDCYRAHKPDA